MSFSGLHPGLTISDVSIGGATPSTNGQHNFTGTEDPSDPFQITLGDPGLTPTSAFLDGDALIPGSVTGPHFVHADALPANITITGTVGSMQVRIDSFEQGVINGTVLSNALGSKAIGTVYMPTNIEAQMANGQINCIQASDLNDGETVTITNGHTSTAYVFEFDIGGGGVSGSNIAVVLTGTETAGQVAAALQAAMFNDSGFNGVFSSWGGGMYSQVYVQNRTAGAAGNVPITHTVVHGSFSVSGLTNGVDFAYAGTRISDGETFTINDGVNTPTVFEFDKNASVSGGSVAVTITDGMNPVALGEALFNAINGVGSTLQVTAEPYSYYYNIFNLVNDNFGSAGNQSLADNVADSGFYHYGMSGGQDPAGGALIALAF